MKNKLESPVVLVSGGSGFTPFFTPSLPLLYPFFTPSLPSPAILAGFQVAGLPGSRVLSPGSKFFILLIPTFLYILHILKIR